MLWIYERGDEDLRIQTTYDNATKEYVITLTRSSNTTVERFNNVDRFKFRLDILERQVKRERWNRTHHPVILSEGWKH